MSSVVNVNQFKSLGSPLLHSCYNHLPPKWDGKPEQTASPCSAMYVSIQLLLVSYCLTEHFVRGNKPLSYPNRRYHPTTFNSAQKEEPDTAADDIQYAYEGGESHAGEVSSPQDSNFQGSSYQPEVYHADESQYHGTGYAEEHGYGYHYEVPEHEYPHELPSLGYHYFPPPQPALPALTTAHPLIETPKQTPPQYTYYYLGRHLWYIPLYFSIYFIIYVGALVLKAVARHKIQFPYNLQMAAANARTGKALEEASKKFYM